MPYRRRRFVKRKYPFRRKYTRRVGSLSRLHGRLPIGKSVTWLPSIRKTRMRWEAVATQAAITLGAYQYTGWAANDIYNVAGGTRQPFGWDQLGALYERWIVVGSKITVSIIPVDSTFSPDVPFMFGAHISPVTTGFDYPDWRGFVESRKGPWVGPLNGCETGIRKFTLGYSPRKYYGSLGEEQFGQLSGTAGATPSSPANRDFFTVWYQPLDLTSGVAAGFWKMQITIDYTVYWFQPFAVQPS